VIWLVAVARCSQRMVSEFGKITWLTGIWESRWGRGLLALRRLGTTMNLEKQGRDVITV